MATTKNNQLNTLTSVSSAEADNVSVMDAPSGAIATPVTIDNEQKEHDNKLHGGHMHTNSTSTHYSVIHFNHPQPTKHRWIKLLINQFFLTRIIIILMSLFILFLCISYGMGQILTLKLEEYFCPYKTLKEIRDRSLDLGLQKGAAHTEYSDACWTTKEFAVRPASLWSQQSYGYESDYSSVSTLKSTAFLFLGIILIIMIIYFIIMLIIDMIKYRNGSIGKKRKLHKKSSMLSNNKYCMMLYTLYSNITSWYSRRFGVDTGGWCLKKVIGEVIEILLQSQAMLLYNGTDFNDGNDVYLAYQPRFIILFSTFLGINCISCSILWLFYAFRPQICHGILFQSILSSMDIIYDAFYAIFPILTVLSNKSFTVSLASLQTTTSLSFWATFVPMIFLVSKCWKLSKNSMKTMRNHFMTTFSNQQQLQSSIQMTSSRSSANNVILRTSTLLTHSTISWILTNQTIGKQLKWKDYLCHIYTKKIMITFLSLIFAIYGIVNMVSVSTHFDDAISFCNEIVVNRDKFAEDLQLNNITDAVFQSQGLMHQRPALFLWDFCEEKVYPFDSMCDCRAFRFIPRGSDSFKTNFVWGFDEMDLYFNISIIEITENILREFKMLEKFGIKHFVPRFIEAGNGYTTPTLFNFTAHLFVAKHLRVLEIEHVDTTGYVDDAIKNLKKLEYVSFWETNINKLPLSFSNLTNIQYFKIGNNRYSTTLPSICKWNKLRALILRTADITQIPHCITNFKSIEIIQLSHLPSLQYIPLGIFGIPTLRELNLEKSFSLTIDGLMEYNNIADDAEFDAKFEYNDNGVTLYGMDESGLCSFNQTLPKFELFLNKTKACIPVCSATSLITQYGCRQYEYQNGRCDHECNSFQCKWDGGDCHQLCECDNYWERLGDGLCDLECNTTHCNYDELDCLPLVYNASNCNAAYKEYGCLSEWVEDGWCDINCQISKECYFDGKDCIYSQYGCSYNCLEAFDIFKFAANTIINDNKISVDEFCSIWVFIKDDPNNNGAFNNCTQIIQYDVNNDSLVSFHEAIIGLNEWFNVDQQKANQIDCQGCLQPHPEDYF